MLLVLDESGDAALKIVGVGLIQAIASDLVGYTIWFDSIGGQTKDQVYGRLLSQAAGRVAGRPRIAKTKAVDL